MLDRAIRRRLLPPTPVKSWAGKQLNFVICDDTWEVPRAAGAAPAPLHETRQETRWLHPSCTAPAQAPRGPELLLSTRRTPSFRHPKTPILLPLAETIIKKTQRTPKDKDCAQQQQALPAAHSLLLRRAGLTWEWTLNFHWYFILLSSSCRCRGCSHTTLTPSTCSAICGGGRRGARLKATSRGHAAEPSAGPSSSFAFTLRPPERGLSANPRSQSSPAAAQRPHAAALANGGARGIAVQSGTPSRLLGCRLGRDEGRRMRHPFLHHR